MVKCPNCKGEVKAERIPLSELAFKNELPMIGVFNASWEVKSNENAIRLLSQKINSLEGPYRLKITIEQVEGI